MAKGSLPGNFKSVKVCQHLQSQPVYLLFQALLFSFFTSSLSNQQLGSINVLVLEAFALLTFEKQLATYDSVLYKFSHLTSKQRVIRRESKTDSYSKDQLFLTCVAFCVITFEPIMIQTCSAPQNDRLIFSFVKDRQVSKK